MVPRGRVDAEDDDDDDDEDDDDDDDDEEEEEGLMRYGRITVTSFRVCLCFLATNPPRTRRNRPLQYQNIFLILRDLSLPSTKATKGYQRQEQKLEHSILVSVAFG